MSKVLEDSSLVETADKLAKYLHVVLSVEYDIDVIDRVAKARRFDDFLEAIYNALRRKFTVERKIRDKMSEANEREKEFLNSALNYIKNFNPSDIEILRSRLIAQSSSIKEIASYIGSKSIASTVLFDNLRRIFGGEG